MPDLTDRMLDGLHRPPTSSEDFETLCPINHVIASSTVDYNFLQTTDVGDDRWYRFIGRGGDALPLFPVPEFRCGTHFGGWLSGFKRGQLDVATTTAAPNLEPPSNHCDEGSPEYNACTHCPQGAFEDGGVDTFGNFCREYCSESGYCGRTEIYKDGGHDCHACKRWPMAPEGSDVADPGGPPIEYSEPGRYPTAAEGKVTMTACFSAGHNCYNQETGTWQPEACGGPTCLRHQDVQVVRCDGFYLWQLDYIPGCHSGYCTTVSEGRNT